MQQIKCVVMNTIDFGYFNMSLKRNWNAPKFRQPSTVITQRDSFWMYGQWVCAWTLFELDLCTTFAYIDIVLRHNRNTRTTSLGLSFSTEIALLYFISFHCVEWMRCDRLLIHKWWWKIVNYVARFAFTHIHATLGWWSRKQFNGARMLFMRRPNDGKHIQHFELNIQLHFGRKFVWVCNNRYRCFVRCEYQVFDNRVACVFVLWMWCRVFTFIFLFFCVCMHVLQSWCFVFISHHFQCIRSFWRIRLIQFQSWSYN